MRKLFLLLFAVSLSIFVFAQAPQKISYQAIIRNATGNLIVNQPVKMRISVLEGSVIGTAVYSELHNPTTNANGLIAIEIGGGTTPTGTFSTINWGSGSYFLKTETDPNNGTEYSIIGNAQLLSVPYALYASKAAELEPTTAAQGQILTYCEGKAVWTTGGTCPASVTSFNCSDALNRNALLSGIPASGVKSDIPYTGGNAGNYTAQSIPSTGVTGLTASLPAGTLNNGNGTLTYTITGIPDAGGTASFDLSIGGQSCTLTRNVVDNAAHSCGEKNVHNKTLIYGTMTDQDDNVYRTIQIDGKVWMAEDLKTTKYRDGTSIVNAEDNAVWETNTTGAYSIYRNDTANNCPYGKLYNWYAVNNAAQLCPTGWHVPTDDEWTSLTNFLGGETDAGGKMKSTGIKEENTGLWFSPNEGATNSSGLSLIPGGLRIVSGSFANSGDAGYWWAATEYDAGQAWTRNVISTDKRLFKLFFTKVTGLSVRCIKDTVTP